MNAGSDLPAAAAAGRLFGNRQCATHCGVQSVVNRLQQPCCREKCIAHSFDLFQTMPARTAFECDEEISQFPDHLFRGVLVAVVREPYQVREQYGDVLEAARDYATGQLDLGDCGRRKDIVEEAIHFTLFLRQLLAGFAQRKVCPNARLNHKR